MNSSKVIILILITLLWPWCILITVIVFGIKDSYDLYFRRTSSKVHSLRNYLNNQFISLSHICRRNLIEECRQRQRLHLTKSPSPPSRSQVSGTDTWQVLHASILVFHSGPCCKQSIPLSGVAANLASCNGLLGKRI